MRSNPEILDDLFRTNGIDLCRGLIFDQAPAPLPREFDFDKVEGMMLGLAAGDALGVTTEGWLPHRRREVYGTIRDYIPNKYVDAPIGFPSDDSQMAFWTLEQMLADGRFVPENVADCFCRRRIFGIGGTVREFIANRKAGKPWHECGPKSAGNGALMRIAPVLIPHLEKPTTDLWVDTALSAMITHNDPGSTAACIAFVNMLWQLLGTDEPPEPQWWLAIYVQLAKELEGETAYRPRTDKFVEHKGPIWRFVQERVAEAYRNDLPVLDACNQWYSGAFLLETVPSVIYILMKHGDDLEEAIVRAVNDTKDNDTIATIVGAAVGALHGSKAIPERWIKNLSGRTTDKDDGKMFELLAAAKQRWGSPVEEGDHSQRRHLLRWGTTAGVRQIENGDLSDADIPAVNGDWAEINHFAYSFDGYDFCESSDDCGRIGNGLARTFTQTGKLDATLTDLRIALFFEARRAHHFGEMPSKQSMKYIRAIVAAIRQHMTGPK